jgi:integrase
VKKRKRRSITVEQLRDVVQKLGPGLGGMAWTMAVTGMGNKEYWETPWHAFPPVHVYIEGSKREGRDRIVPYVSPLTAPQMQPKAFAKKLKAAAPVGVTIYSLRRTFAVILANSGVPQARRAIYMGHGAPKDMTMWYEMSQEVEDYLREDSQRMREYLGETGPALKVMA